MKFSLTEFRGTPPLALGEPVNVQRLETVCCLLCVGYTKLWVLFFIMLISFLPSRWECKVTWTALAFSVLKNGWEQTAHTAGKKPPLSWGVTTCRRQTARCRSLHHGAGRIRTVLGLHRRENLSRSQMGVLLSRSDTAVFYQLCSKAGMEVVGVSFWGLGFCFLFLVKY